MDTVLVTGASGFIGRALCRSQAEERKVVGFVQRKPEKPCQKVKYFLGCIANKNDILSALKDHPPDILIHCAGIAYEKYHGRVAASAYEVYNQIATKNFIHKACEINPEVHIIFLSSVSVYGESQKDSYAVSENELCRPTGNYAESKLLAEKHIEELFSHSVLNRAHILRLAPVYDRNWSQNLDKRVYGPKKLCFIKYGSGEQKLSALARENLVDFISFIMRKPPSGRFLRIMNVCDLSSYSFNDIIKVFQSSGNQPDRLVFQLPLPILRAASLTAAHLTKSSRGHVIYNKLAHDFIYDNAQMLGTGFKHTCSLESVFEAPK